MNAAAGLVGDVAPWVDSLPLEGILRDLAPQWLSSGLELLSDQLQEVNQSISAVRELFIRGAEIEDGLRLVTDMACGDTGPTGTSSALIDTVSSNFSSAKRLVTMHPRRGTLLKLHHLGTRSETHPDAPQNQVFA